MSNGYLVASNADIAAAREIGEGFGLDVIDASAVGDNTATAEALAAAANVGVLISSASVADASFVALLEALAAKLPRAQLILADADARAALPFLPDAWPTMSLEDARTRAAALANQRQQSEGAAAGEESPEAPAPQTETAAEEPAAEPPIRERAIETEAVPAPEQSAGELLGGVEEQESFSGPADESAASGDEPAPEADRSASEEAIAEPPAAAAPPEEPPDAPPLPKKAEEPAAPPPQVIAPPPTPTPPPAGDSFGGAVDMHSTTRSSAGPERLGETAPADATAFAPKKLRRGTPELVRIVVHQPKDLNAVIKAAKKIDPRTDAAPSGMSIGEVALGASIGVALEVRGAACDGALQRRIWNGEPIDFSFSVEADASVKQVVLLARVFIDDAQIGVLAFTRNVSGPAKKPHSIGDRVRLKRHKRVFLSYSSKDRETVAAIATAYQMAGVEHFWDRTSLKSGETWHPRLRREIDRADLFHLCWSRNAAESEWVKKEAEHAITRRKRNSGKPEVTVQMLDGPPWAKHPAELDSINFDDFVRAAIVGYARGDGSAP